MQMEVILPYAVIGIMLAFLGVGVLLIICSIVQV